jgi:hypothetical protein
MRIRSSFLKGLLGTILGTALLLGCATYREDLNRGQRLYEENSWGEALAIWRVLEPDMDALSWNDQARYAYLRGMTDYRLKFRPDARHWLGIAKATEQEHPGGLSSEWKRRLDEALTDLNQEVYGIDSELRKSRSTFVERSKKTEDESSDGNSQDGSDNSSGSPDACQRSSDCPAEHVCQDNACVKL